MYQSISSFEHLLLYFSSDFFTYQLNFSIVLPVWALNTLEFSVSLSILSQVSVFCTFSDTVNAGYHEQAKAYSMA